MKFSFEELCVRENHFSFTNRYSQNNKILEPNEKTKLIKSNRNNARGNVRARVYNAYTHARAHKASSILNVQLINGHV